jgi:hypothetical protein
MALEKIQWISLRQCEPEKGHTMHPGVRKLLDLGLVRNGTALLLADSLPWRRGTACPVPSNESGCCVNSSLGQDALC